MVTNSDIIAKARELGFEDIGFTTAEAFDDHKKLLESMPDEYGWTQAAGIDLINGTDPKTILKGAQSIIVLLELYFKKSYPRKMEGTFGRCYLDDDRVTKDGLSLRIKAFRSYLRDQGIASKVPFNLPHRVAAARAGMGTFGKNCLFYSSKVARQSSWTLPIALVVDHVFEPGIPTIETNCPDWCRNACIAACPTRALKGNSRIDPRKCISYLSYFGQGITPTELREPMGMFVYGCDRCQNVCPRNLAWLAKDLPVNENVVVKADDFDLSRLLHMDKDYFENKIWPHMFYMSYEDIWRWRMNVARVMGNSLDPVYIPDLTRAFEENTDERVKGMIAWALGRIGGKEARKALEQFSRNMTSENPVGEEIHQALLKTTR
ncbi:MAG: epoxyqueuosine reductase [Proteobacteria bacterium]|nr:epoxyqueuosine reductase [Pseudomonadota bacterium]